MVRSDDHTHRLPWPEKRLTRTEKAKYCMDCPALCCRDLSIAIKRPKTHEDIVELKWRLHFDNVDIIIRHRRWYMLIRGKCIHLGKDNLCTNYEYRSETCYAHNPPDCERFSHFYDHIIRRPEELDDYLAGNWYDYERAV